MDRSGSETPECAESWLPRMARLGVVALAFTAPWPLAQAATGGDVSLVSCAPDTYNCTANDAQGAITVTAPDIPSCTYGEWVDVPVTINATTSGNNERLDIGAWFVSDTPGQCWNAMTTATDNVAGQFKNIDGDSCGDMSGNATASQTFTVKVQCNFDADGKVTFPTLAYWSNHKSANVCNPYPAAKPKCTRGETTVNVTAIKGKITVKKIAADAGTLAFPFNVTGGTTQTFSLKAGDSKEIEVDATKNGTSYTITETVPAGWAFSSATCTSNNGRVWSNEAGSRAVTVPVSFADRDISCEFVNTKIPADGTVKLVKALTVDDPGQFTYTLGGSTSAASGGSGEKLSGTFTEKTTVSFSEAAAAGTGTELGNYSVSWRCVRADNQAGIAQGADSSGSFTMPDGAPSVVCTITNNRRMFKLTLKKALSPEKDTGKFNLLVNGQGASNVGHGDEYSINVPMGSQVTISETEGANTQLANYSSQLVCDRPSPIVNPLRESRQVLPPVDPVLDTRATFDMPGRNVTCTFTNTRISAKLKVAKAWGAGFAAGDKATVKTTGFTNNASSGESTAGTGTTGAEVTVYAGESGQLTESFSAGTMANYTQSYACSGGVAVDAEGNISIAAADKDKTITCTLTNTRKRASVRITKSSSVPGPVAPGSELTYTVVVRNTGQIALGGQSISDPMPAGVASQTWTCSGTGGATCNPASGDGDVTGTVNLPVGGEVTYTIKARLKDTLTAAVTNIARVVVPPGTSCEEPQEQQAARERPANVVVNPVVCEAEASNPPAPPAPAAVTPVPTTSPEGLAALALMMLGVAGWAARRHGKRK